MTVGYIEFVVSLGGQSWLYTSRSQSSQNIHSSTKWKLASRRNWSTFPDICTSFYFCICLSITTITSLSQLTFVLLPEDRNLLCCSLSCLPSILPLCNFQNALSKTQILSYYYREYANFLFWQKIFSSSLCLFSVLPLFPSMAPVLNYLNFLKQNVLVTASVPCT